ncbi:MAG TPA: transcriptional repressor LexA [Rhodanobacteraceae bacterium]|nr:transcriptional repressor LexA [Rhodanobacteraceae bacterium]
MATRDLSPNEIKGLMFIRDSIRYRGRAPSFQMIADHLGFRSRRSSGLLIKRLTERGYLARTPGGNLRLLREPQGATLSERTIPIPLVGSAPCGLPLMAEENVEAMISVSQRIARPGAAYFLLRAIGTSMNQAGINDGDLLLVRQQPVAANGDRVVALIDDEATIKELHQHPDKIVLMPRSSDPVHQPIILQRDFWIQGVVVEVIPGLGA